MSTHEHDAAPVSVSDVDDTKKEHGHNHEHEHGESSAKIVGLGTVTLGGATFMIDRDGQVEAGKTTEFGVELVGTGSAAPTAGWLANPDGEKICDPVSSEGHDNHWHFNVEPLMPVKRSKFVLALGTEEATVDWARGAEPVNEGILAVFKAAHAPERRAFLELKLHGDAGDLELWLYDRFPVSNWKTVGKPDPFDVPKEAVMRITFLSHAGKTVELRVRNHEQNEGEDGNPNMRAGKTNYFIFPGESGADAQWLVGEKGRYVVSVAFEAEGKSYACDPFVLVPHEAL